MNVMLKLREISHHSYRSLSLLHGLCLTNTYDGIRFESEFGHVKREGCNGLLGLACCLMVTAGAEIHFQKPLLYNIANTLFFDFLISDHKQINELLVKYL